MHIQPAAGPAPSDAYFIRHTRVLGIEESWSRVLAGENRVFVHFPHGPSGDTGADLESIDPAVHDRRGRKALEKMHRLAKSGGIVCAEYWHEPARALVGLVPPDARVELKYGRWGSRYPKCAGRTAVVKTLQLQDARWLSSNEYLPLAVGRPRQGTIGRWVKAAGRLQHLVRGISADVGLDALLPEHQEVLCAEALRVPAIASEFGLKPIQHVLFPIGRTRRDMDIEAVDTDGHRLLVQVTYLALGAASQKVAKLKAYAAPSTTLALVCQAPAVTEVEGIRVVPLEKIFSSFRALPTATAWLNATRE